MKRRTFIVLATSAAIAKPLGARAQQPGQVPRIGLLSVQYAAAPGVNTTAFLKGLRELGYSEGRNLIVEYRWAEYQLDRLPGFAAELVARNLDVIVALEPPGVRAAIAATKRIPIVMRSTIDPVADGLVASLARPGGNVTGVATESAELHGKRLELLKELRPDLKRVAVLWNDTPAGRMQLDPIAAAARAIGADVVRIQVSSAKQLDEAFAAAASGGAGALIIVRDPVFVEDRRRVAQLAAAHRLLAAYDEREYAKEGGLVSYGADLAEVYRHAAVYVDKILKGARPADLPVELPTKFELVINLKTARALGLTVPPTLLARADEVIE